MKSKFIYWLLAAVLIATSSGCRHNLIDEELNNIIVVNSEIREYINKASSSVDLDTLYRETVLHSNIPEFATLSMYSEVLQPISDLDELERYLDAISSENVEDIISGVIERCHEYEFMPEQEVTVYLFPLSCQDDSALTLKGVRTFSSPGLDVIVLEVNTGTDDWDKTMQYSLAREYYRLAFDHLTKDTLLELLILYGRADSFAKAMFPDIESPWQQESISQNTLDLIKSGLNSTKGHDEIIRQSGLIFGYKIMQQFIMNNPEVSIEEWSIMPAREIFEGSEFQWD